MRRDQLKAYVVVGAFLVLLGGGITCGSFSWKYKTSLGPGPAFFPFWIGLIIAAMGALMGAINVVSLIRGRGVEEKAPSEQLFKAVELKNVGVITGALVGSVLFLKWLGFVLTIGLFSLFLLQIVGKTPELIGEGFGIIRKLHPGAARRGAKTEWVQNCRHGFPLLDAFAPGAQRLADEDVAAGLLGHS